MDGRASTSRLGARVVVWRGVWHHVGVVYSPLFRESSVDTVTPEPLGPRSNLGREHLGIAAGSKILGVDVKTLERYIDRGQIEGFKLPSGHRRVFIDAIERAMASSTVDSIRPGPTWTRYPRPLEAGVELDPERSAPPAPSPGSPFAPAGAAAAYEQAAVRARRIREDSAA